MIEVKNLHKQFGRSGEIVAVDDVSFTANDGVVTGLLGPNGAGKTTTLRVLSTLIKPDRGSAFIDGIDVAKDPIGARRVLGMLPDTRGLYPRLTAREHIHYFAELQGMSKEQIAARTQELLELLEMAPLADRRVDGFSNGERTKVAICRALVHGPKNVVLDEPTNGLDVMSTRAVRTLIRSLREQGRCVVFSSHVMQEVGALCDRIVVIARGRVVAEGTPAELLARSGKESLEEAFVSIIGSDAGLTS